MSAAHVVIHGMSSTVTGHTAASPEQHHAAKTYIVPVVARTCVAMQYSKLPRQIRSEMTGIRMLHRCIVSWHGAISCTAQTCHHCQVCARP